MAPVSGLAPASVSEGQAWSRGLPFVMVEFTSLEIRSGLLGRSVVDPSWCSAHVGRMLEPSPDISSK